VLGRSAGLSRSHFSRAFKQSTDTAPRVYLMHKRLERACKLLVDTDLLLVEIALACGFSDQSHFCRRLVAGHGTRCFRLLRSPSAARCAFIKSSCRGSPEPGQNRHMLAGYCH
jgi:AraC-like DNA-binding protein